MALVPILLAHAAHGAMCETAKTQREIESCMRAESVAADQELGKAYAQYKGGLQGEQLGLLEKAQETWTAYRDANCRASAAAYEGGTLAVAELDGCKMRLARERIAELKRIYEEPPLPAERE